MVMDWIFAPPSWVRGGFDGPVMLASAMVGMGGAGLASRRYLECNGVLLEACQNKYHSSKGTQENMFWTASFDKKA